MGAFRQHSVFWLQILIAPLCLVEVYALLSSLGPLVGQKETMGTGYGTQSAVRLLSKGFLPTGKTSTRHLTLALKSLEAP